MKMFLATIVYGIYTVVYIIILLHLLLAEYCGKKVMIVCAMCYTVFARIVAAHRLVAALEL